MKILTNPVIFLKMWFDVAGKKNPFTISFHSSWSKVCDSIEELRHHFRNLEETKRNLRELRRAIYKSGTSKLFENNLIESKKFLSQEFELEKYVDFNHSVWSCGGDRFVEIVIAYFKTILQTDQELKNSDFADLLHAAYIPYCDLWRGDSVFSNMLIKQNIMEKEKIVPKLTELPARIEEALRRSYSPTV